MKTRLAIALVISCAALLARPRAAAAEDGGDAAAADGASTTDAADDAADAAAAADDAASDGGTDAAEGGVPLACDGALCDTTNSSTCAAAPSSLGRGSTDLTAVAMAATVLLVLARRRKERPR